MSHGAYLFVENLERSTPCDLAERYGHKDIALYLESKMIFSVILNLNFLGSLSRLSVLNSVRNSKSEAIP